MKKKVVVHGATGMIGQKFVQLLADHPWLVVLVPKELLTEWDRQRNPILI